MAEVDRPCILAALAVEWCLGLGPAQWLGDIRCNRVSQPQPRVALPLEVWVLLPVLAVLHVYWYISSLVCVLRPLAACAECLSIGVWCAQHVQCAGY